jgi:hypothetical protein
VVPTAKVSLNNRATGKLFHEIEKRLVWDRAKKEFAANGQTVDAGEYSPPRRY